ncbi:uncharacterized protein LOC125652729 [Ostrea edulis]|uniref:uncharacterized protein LOC125652729 n=1 Tax=Ostrea edulis TaxID=37623 RepID=UPI0024AFB48A|nr:uncharacterized protein LOC125652729 [Ostrea edulis]
MLVGEALIKEQFMEYLKMKENESKPEIDLLTCTEEKTDDEIKEQLFGLIGDFIEHYGYCKVDTEHCKPRDLLGDQYYKLCNLDSEIVLVPFTTEKEDDVLFNYSLQLCHWYLHLLEMNDTAKEGDLNRVILNCQYSLPFFFSHSALSKYMVENIDYILKCQHFLSPLQRIRVLEGSFTNCRGEIGKNVESDLVQEHSVCHQKQLIKSLGANKTEQSISRVTRSADAINEICTNFDNSILLKPKSGRHAKVVTEADQTRMYKELRKLRPFHHTPGRACDGFNKIGHVPLKCNDFPKLNLRIDQVVKRLTRGFTIELEDEDDVEDNDNLENLPAI